MIDHVCLSQFLRMGDFGAVFFVVYDNKVNHVLEQITQSENMTSVFYFPCWQASCGVLLPPVLQS